MIGDPLKLTQEQSKIVKAHIKQEQNARTGYSEACSNLANASMNLWLAIKEMFPDIYAKHHLLLTPTGEIIIDRERREDERDWAETRKNLG